jgi:hypothetical protein
MPPVRSVLDLPHPVWSFNATPIKAQYNTNLEYLLVPRNTCIRDFIFPLNIMGYETTKELLFYKWYVFGIILNVHSSTDLTFDPWHHLRR